MLGVPSTWSAISALATEAYHCSIVQASFPSGCTLLLPHGTRELHCRMHVGTIAARPVRLQVMANAAVAQQDGAVSYSDMVQLASLVDKTVSGTADTLVDADIRLPSLEVCRELHISAQLQLPGSTYVLDHSDLDCRVAEGSAVAAVALPPGPDVEVAKAPPIQHDDLVEGLPGFDIAYRLSGTDPGYLQFRLDGGPVPTSDNLQMAKGSPVVAIPVPAGGGRLHVEMRELLGAGAGWTQPIALSVSLVDLDGTAIFPEKLLYHVDPRPTAP